MTRIAFIAVLLFTNVIAPPALAQDVSTATLNTDMLLNLPGGVQVPLHIGIVYPEPPLSINDCLALGAEGTPENTRFKVAMTEMIAASLAAKLGGTFTVGCEAVELVPTPRSSTSASVVFPVIP